MQMAHHCTISWSPFHGKNLPFYRIIRMCSWRGSIYLSGEWNDAQYSKEDVQLFLDDIAFSMLSLGTNV